MTRIGTAAATNEHWIAEGRAGYLADFGVYAVLLVVLIAVGVSGRTGSPRNWLAAATVGAAVWTLIEYGLQRFVFQKVPAIAAIHLVHHRRPCSYLWTPTWLSLTILAGLFLAPLWRWASPPTALGAVSGIVGGYLWYGIERHVIHHGRPRWLALRLRNAGRRHALHHGSGNSGNFGVRSAIWDVAFDTVLGDREQQPNRESTVEP